MNPFKKFALSLPVLLLALPALAQDPNYDPKAKEILNGVSATAKAYTSINATFSITLKDAAGKSDVKNGSIVLKDGKYKITLDNTVGTVIKKEEYYNDGKTTWVYSEKDKEVNIDCYDPTKKNANGFSINDLFNMDIKGFKYKYIKEETQNGKVVQLVELYPEKPDKKNFSIVKVTIDKVKKQVISVVLVNKDGSSTTYAIKTFTPNQDTPDATFQYDEKTHPGVTKVDLRDTVPCQ